jgi:Tfp pilus assembly protein PilN
MIRVNLLEGTAEQRVSLQKTKVAARRGQQLFMLAAAVLILVAVIAIDHIMTNNAHAAAKVELEKEEAEAKKLEENIKRKEELESEIKALDERIKIIKQLRAEQKGPVAMLSEINRRMPGPLSDFRLLSITQKGDQVQIIGTSVDQQVIANFAKNLEFSNNLFSNLRLSVEGKEVKADKVPTQTDPGDKKPSADEVVRLFQFTIDCNYNKPRAEGEAQEDKPAAKQAK